MFLRRRIHPLVLIVLPINNQNNEKKITNESDGKKITSASKNQAFTTAGGWSVNNHQYADFAPVMLPVPNIEGCSNQR